ncbi:MAG: twin-arginine translocase TatA/TatE family subunit [Pseudomonadota bacterium]|nr:twin-arginine translocase subunit TatA [Gammaproteobacteria bacterium]MEE2684543.1 twin-arginine translocase TatA/TatE family subunit [Pseudomonadota bacterium]|tara:strand:+ start:1338 stop:1568 length:231 start_codon:yes stop_codon:yes gene_type:complete
MGVGGISMWQLLIILLIVVLIFGTKRLKTLGGDLGGAMKSFRKAMDSEEKEVEIEKLGESSQDADFADQKEKTKRK